MASGTLSSGGFCLWQLHNGCLKAFEDSINFSGVGLSLWIPAAPSEYIWPVQAVFVRDVYHGSDAAGTAPQCLVNVPSGDSKQRRWWKRNGGFQMWRLRLEHGFHMLFADKFHRNPKHLPFSLYLLPFLPCRYVIMCSRPCRDMASTLLF